MSELILEAGRTEQNDWRRLGRDRELFYFLAWRDILVRYKQTVIGMAWAVLRPFLTMLAFTVVVSPHRQPTGAWRAVLCPLRLPGQAALARGQTVCHN